MKRAGKLSYLFLPILLSACVANSTYPSNDFQKVAAFQKPDKPETKPEYDLACEDGRNFSLTIGRDQLQLTFPGQPDVEILDDDHVAEGMEYSNTRYILRQNEGNIVLADLTQSRAKVMQCHRSLLR